MPPGSRGPRPRRLLPLQTALDPSMGTTGRPGSRREEFPPVHPGSLKASLAWGIARRFRVKAGGQRKSGPVKLFSQSEGVGRSLSSGQASSEGAWAPCMDTLRPGYTRRHVGDTRVFVWAHVQTCSSIRLCIRKHIGKNTLQNTHANTHTHVLRGMWTPV